jgi:hypothetical protein
VSTWFDERARASATSRKLLSPAKRRKVAQIKAGLAGTKRGNTALRDHFHTIDILAKSAMKARSGRVNNEWLVRIEKIALELRRVRDEFAHVDTGLRAERNLRSALSNTIVGVDAWRAAMGSDDARLIDAKRKVMAEHFGRAHVHARQGLSDLKNGR